MQGVFIDLAILLDNYPTTRSNRLILQDGHLSVEPCKPETKITSIEVWTDAFVVFMSIYCSQHTHRFMELLKYLQTIRLAPKRSSSHGWKIYDEQYRLRKAKDPASTWSMIDTEL
ncbi:hypothetical protein SNE40_007206 [Patella caerulea]|uniref:Uncharacterized protein n=1 Tax=Patella caerulea TaxID=87958 RepID=A0AAN8K355_PATCE